MKMNHFNSFIILSMLIKMTSCGFFLRGSSDPLVVPLGGSVVLPCSVDSLLSLKDLEVEWRRSDSQTLIHLYQDEDIRPESQHQDYHDRAHFFTEDIKHGNFSLLLNNLTAEDEGQYTCKVHTGQESEETVVEIKHVERLIVSGSSRSISVYVGDDVTLSCSVNSHIKPEEIEEVSWRKTDKDEDILVLLYQNNETQSGSSDERYRDRVEFFTDEIHRGNFSLRLKRVRTEDKGVYICQVFTGRLSANTTVKLEQLGLSALHIIVLILCITGCGSTVIIYCLICCRADNTAKSVKTLGYIHVLLPNIIMFLAFVLWGVTEGFLYETVLCCALCLMRPLMLFFTSPHVNIISESCFRYAIGFFAVVYFSVLFKHAWDTSVHYTKSDRVDMIVVFAVVILLIVCLIINEALESSFSGQMSDGELSKWILNKFDAVGFYSLHAMPSLQFILLFFAFEAAGRGGLFIVVVFFPLFFYLSTLCYDCEGRKCSLFLSTTWLSFVFITNAVIVFFFVTSLKIKKDAAGWSSTAVFLQMMWIITGNMTTCHNLDVPFKKILYAFGSVGVFLINAVALMTELILKTVHGERAVGDLRIVLFSSESLFSLAVMTFMLFRNWISDIKCLQSCKNAENPDANPDIELNQNQDFQNAESSDEIPDTESNQNQTTTESHELNPLLNIEDQETDRSEALIQPD
ncbi:uncharacterized protein [Misgurnus anguillicaudatus]|uniref:uncharacterized protein n=1 Tax=Misgurnus anguillicaudatus TaxID=75329 RepID=UPI003CCF7C58